MDFPYRRVLIVGCGGSGKSTLAREMGERTGLPVVHLDRLWWRSGWVHVTREEFDAALEEELKKPAWIIDGDYSRTFARRLEYADFCVFLDLDAETCLRGVKARVEAYRGRTRPDMAEGCPERMDAEFEQWIRDFNEERRPAMLAALEGSGVPHGIFATREAAWSWLGGAAPRADGEERA